MDEHMAGVPTKDAHPGVSVKMQPQTGPPAPADPPAPMPSERRARREGARVPGRQRAEWGGTLLGAACLGWLAAAGASIFMTDFVVAAGTAVRIGTATAVTTPGGIGELTTNGPMGITGAVSLFGIHFLAYCMGGYVAGRISRFSGATQGFLVWVVSLVVAVLIAALTTTAGGQYNVLAELSVFPRLPVGEGVLSPATAITVVLVTIVSLVGAVIGGALGNEFYRRAARRGVQY
ncbi:hypothetical protein B0I08_101401 [Glaciihabitans tibetensis]|uniref:Uncharacterized protein n=1 Tax=Glaciihabitans tibetensis TaxID=1266600 RepID=A0A2T0VJ70_9MICO|nr:hypothetical protein [Glaciihabitans tibetensis]PRY70271.1 hypothetical protein B0I08_101401 [Glaciihabitans tibetensis]